MKHPIYRIIDALGWSGTLEQVRSGDQSLEVRHHTILKTSGLSLKHLAHGPIEPEKILVPLKPFLHPDGTKYWLGQHDGIIFFEEESP